MTAPVEQLRRWQQMLAFPDDPPAPDGLRLADDLVANAGQHRRWLTTCLAAIDAIRRGGNVPYAVDLPPMPLRAPASNGVAAASAVWQAYLLWTNGDGNAAAWLREATVALDPVALIFTLEDNPEPWWQNEMLILHALHSFALRTRDPALLEKTLDCADFHLREIQPDHATNEPWSIHAYASHPDGNVTAETLLHAGHIQHGGTLGPVARLVAHDASAALEAYLAP